MPIQTDIIYVHISNNFEYRVLTDDFLKDLLIKKNVGREVDCHAGLGELCLNIGQSNDALGTKP